MIPCLNKHEGGITKKKHCGKRRKKVLTGIFSFAQNGCQTSCRLQILSDLGKSQCLSSGNELTR